MNSQIILQFISFDKFCSQFGKYEFKQVLLFTSFNKINNHLVMSVKDKIAMWNSMGNNNKNTYPTPKTTFKTTFSTTENTLTQKIYKPTEPKTQNKTFIVETQSIMKPSIIKKQQSTPNKNYASARISAPVIMPSSTSSSQGIMTPSQLKKLMAAGQGPYFTVPQQPAPRAPINKPITQVPQTPLSNQTNTFDIVKDVPIVNVKQNAKRLSEFYKTQAQLQAKKAEELKNAQTENTERNQTSTEQTILANTNQKSNREHQLTEDTHTVSESKQNEPLIKYEQSGNITLNYPPTVTQQPQNKQKPQQIQHNTNYDLAAMLRTKKRMTKARFNDSDQD